MLAPVLLLAAVSLVWTARRQIGRTDPGRCRECGYSRDGLLGENPKCPECGRLFPSLRALSAMAANQADRLLLAGLGGLILVALVLGLALGLGVLAGWAVFPSGLVLLFLRAVRRTMPRKTYVWTWGISLGLVLAWLAQTFPTPPSKTDPPDMGPAIWVLLLNPLAHTLLIFVVGLCASTSAANHKGEIVADESEEAQS